jgi:hypothetical protein
MVQTPVGTYYLGAGGVWEEQTGVQAYLPVDRVFDIHWNPSKHRFRLVGEMPPYCRDPKNQKMALRLKEEEKAL